MDGDELREVAEKHYMKGGKIGEFTAFEFSAVPGGTLHLFGPFRFPRKAKTSAEDFGAGLIKEPNNRRHATSCVFGFLSATTIIVVLHPSPLPFPGPPNPMSLQSVGTQEPSPISWTAICSPAGAYRIVRLA